MEKWRKVVTMKFRSWRHVGTDATISRPEALGSPGADWEEIPHEKTPEHQRLWSAVVEKARIWTDIANEVKRNGMDAVVDFELYEAIDGLRDAVNFLIAFEAENGIGVK